MEKITHQRKTYKSIEDGTEEYYTYRTSDGKEFTSEAIADQHERDMRFDSIQRIEDGIPETYGRWYKARNEEELEILKSRLGFYDTYDRLHVTGDLKIGEWFEAHHWDGGDYKGDNYFITLTEYKKIVNDFFSFMY